MQSPPNPADAAPTLSVNKTVFLASSLVSILLIVFTILFPQASEAVLGNALRWVSDHFGWYYMLVVAAYSLFALYVGLSRYGDIKLGQDHDKPDFPFLTWAAMLFSAGIGIDLLFSAHPSRWRITSPRPMAAAARPKRRVRPFRRHFCIGVYTAGAFMR